MSVTRLLPLGVLLAAACGPNSTAPVKVMALVLDAQGAYKPTPIELKTVRDVVALDGSAATLRGGAKVVLNTEELSAYESATGGLTAQQFREIVLKNQGGPVHASYQDNQGVLWPTDFHTWNMVGTYYNFERAFTYFQSTQQVPLATLEGGDVFYFPEVTWPGLDATDNAYFLSPLEAFLVLGFDKAQQIPFPMNAGIIAHEYSHQVFNRLTYQGAPFPLPLVAWSASPSSASVLKAFDEGLADFHAVEASCTAAGCDTRFFEPSLGAAITDARDIGKNDHCVTSQLVNDLYGLSTDQFTAIGDHYVLGTVLATALYKAGEANGASYRQGLQRAVLAAYSDPNTANPGLAQLIEANANTPEQFTITAALNAIAKHIPDLGMRDAVCQQFFDRFGLTNASDLPDCPPASVSPASPACP